MEMGLKGKTALVMASSQGLGRAIAEQLVKEGANVMLASRNEEKLKQVRNELAAMGTGKAEYTVCDITNKHDIHLAVRRAADIFGRLDILVNNAGGPTAGGFEDISDEEWHKSFELNLLSYIRLVREALPYLKKQGGRIINIASISIREPIPGLILSNTFRLGIVGLAKSLAEELAPYGILVNTVAPGRILTERIQELDKATAAKKGMTVDEVAAAARKSIPLGRDGKPEEFARVVAFLASEANTYMTGSSFFVDGGKLRSI
ncbi:MAG TPA: SDR family oxidoreductase [Bacillaceae bacterium]